MEKTPEGARYLHDKPGDVFLGRYDDADLYAEFWERVGEGNEFGLPAGIYGSCFVRRLGDAKMLGVKQMLHRMQVTRAATIGDADPYMAEAYRLAKERGWIREPDRPSRVACLFMADK